MFEERIVLPEGGFFDLRLLGVNRYSLSFRRARQVLVEYKGGGKRHSKMLRGRVSPYEFKSVEKLRYDFERDVEDALRQG